MADPFGTLAPGNGLFGLTSPADQERNQLAELLRLYGDPARRQNKMATLLGGDILPGGGNRLPQGRDDPAYLGPPTIQPGSGDWWIDQAIGFTPAGAVRDLVRVAEDAEALPPSPSFGQLAPVIGSGILAAAGMVPGGRQTARAAKLYDEALSAARAAGLDVSDAARVARLEALKQQGVNDQYWRGGKDVADGPWYAPDVRKAENFDKGDLRRYAIDERAMLRSDKAYGPALFRAIAKEMEGYNPAGAKQWREMADANEAVTGTAVWQMLQHTSNGAEALLRKLGFTSVDGVNEILVLDPGIVRDAERAMFNPAMRGKPNPFGALLPVGAAAAAGAYATGRSGNDDPL